PAASHGRRGVARARHHAARIARGAAAPGAGGVRSRRGGARGGGRGAAGPGDRGGAARAGTGPCGAGARARRAVPGRTRPGRVARGGRRAVRLGRTLGAPARPRGDQEPRGSILRGCRARAGAHPARGTPHLRVPAAEPRRAPAIYSWYLRLWPWEGNDLLYGLLRVEARADAATVAQAAAVSAGLFRERAPVSTPDARWDRLLYPIDDVETYLRSLAPRDLLSHPGSRLPR